MDEFMNSVLTTQLFANTFSIPLDLASLNLQRGREHGLAPYPIWRNFCYEVFGKVSDFENKLTLVRFLQLYGSLETLDLWIGGLAEERLPDSLLGATFSCIFGLTFSRVRDGDRFFYRQPGVFTEAQLKQIRQRSISNVLCDTSDQILSIQPDAFLSNQSRIPCSQLPSFDYTVFSEDACYFRARIRPRNVEVPISVFSRSVSSEFIFTESRVGPSRRNEFQCVQIQCPTPTIPVDLVVFSTQQLLEDLSISPEDNLPPSNAESSAIYRAELPSALFDAKRGGLFRSMEACEASRNEFAFTFEFSTFTSEAKALEQELASQAKQDASDNNKVGEKMEVEITDDVMKILQTRNKHLKKVATSEEVEKVGVAKETKAKADATDEMLLKELESALKSM
jgi:peroxidase